LNENVVVIDADAVHDHPAVMVVFHTARSTLRAVVHPWELIGLTGMAVFKLSVILHLIVDHAIWRERIIENHSFVSIFEQWRPFYIWRGDIGPRGNSRMVNVME